MTGGVVRLVSDNLLHALLDIPAPIGDRVGRLRIKFGTTTKTYKN